MLHMWVTSAHQVQLSTVKHSLHLVQCSWHTHRSCLSYQNSSMYPLWAGWSLPGQKGRLSTVGRQNITSALENHWHVTHHLNSQNKPLQTAMWHRRKLHFNQYTSPILFGCHVAGLLALWVTWQQVKPTATLQPVYFTHSFWLSCCRSPRVVSNLATSETNCTDYNSPSAVCTRCCCQALNTEVLPWPGIVQTLSTIQYTCAQTTLHRLQCVQDAAARLLCGASPRTHAPPLLNQLHWLPVSSRIQFKLSTLIIWH